MNKYLHKEVLCELLSFNGYEYAESLIKKNSNNDSVTAAVGLLLDVSNKNLKNQILQLNEDTYSNCSVSFYLKVAQKIGFQTILQYPFVSEILSKEYFYVLWNEMCGILLKIITKNMDNVRSSVFYYNWKPHENKYLKDIMADGHFTKDKIWVGDQDGKEALKLKIHSLFEKGNFIFPWIEKPIMNLSYRGIDDKIHAEIVKILQKKGLDFLQ